MPSADGVTLVIHQWIVICLPRRGYSLYRSGGFVPVGYEGSGLAAWKPWHVVLSLVGVGEYNRIAVLSRWCNASIRSSEKQVNDESKGYESP